MSAGAPSEGVLVESGADDGDLAISFRKGAKVAYSTEFLLSMAVLDVCQRLPCNFDSDILCELGERPKILFQPKTDSEFAKWDGNILSTCWKVKLDRGILGRNTSESGTLGRNSPESGILGKGVFLRAPEPIAVNSAPKIHEDSCHLLARSSTPYRPPHLYKMNLLSGTEKMDIGSEKTLDSLKPRRTEVERQREASESLWTERQEIQETQKNISDDQKENQDPSNATGSADSQKDGVDESWTSEKLKSNIGQSTMSCPYFLSWIKPTGNTMSNIDGKRGTGEAPIDHTTKLNEQPFISIPSESNKDTNQSHPSTSLSAATEVFQQQLHERGNKSTLYPNPSGQTTELKLDNSGLDDADYQNLLALLEEETMCQSTELWCSQDLSWLGFSEFNLGGHRPMPASCDDGVVLSSEVDASSCNETILKGDERASEVNPEFSTEQQTLLDPAAADFHNKPCTGDEICWPDEDSLITIEDFLCPADEVSCDELYTKQSSCPQLLGSPVKPEKKMNTTRVYVPKPMGPSMCSPPPPTPPGMGPWFPVLPPLPPHSMRQIAPYPPAMWSSPFANQFHVYTNLLSSPDHDLAWPWFGNA